MEAEASSNRRLLIGDAFYVGAWHVQPRLNLITGPRAAVQVEPRIMEVLVCLAAQPGEVVTRAELHEKVWPGIVVSDKALTRTISVLRKVFGDDPREPRVIATISKTGYRLIAPVSGQVSGDGVQPRAGPAGAALVVRPPASPSRRRTQAYAWGAAVVLCLVSSGLTWLFLSSEPALPVSPALPFTTFAGHEISPQLAPDGRAVVFAWEGASGNNWDIYVKQPGMERPLRLTDHPADDLHPIWSPDGTQIAFIRHEEAACSILVVPVLSGPEQRLAPCRGSTSPGRVRYTFKVAWSPDGKTLAVEEVPSDHEPASLYLLSLETQTRTRLTHPETSLLGDTHPVFAPDGRRLSFIRYRDWGDADLYVVSLPEGEERRITFHHRPMMGHDWTPDGKRLLFSSNRNGVFQLWQVPASGGEPAWVPLLGWNLEAFSMARRGHRLVYENWLYDVNIWRISLREDQASHRHVASSLWDTDPAYASDGRIAFVSNRSGAYEVWMSRPDASEPVQLTRFQGPMVRSPRWSPDGTRLVFEVRRQEHADLYVVDAAGGAAQRVTSDPADEVAPAWSPDGNGLYFGSNRSGAWRIWQMPSDGGPAMPVTVGEGYAPQLSGDGAYVYYARSDGPGIWRVPTGGGEETLVLETLAPGDWGNWSLSDRGLYFVRRTATDVFLAFYDFEARTTQDLRAFEQPPPRFQKGLSLSPDGRWLLHARLDQTQSDLMLVESFR